MYFIFSFASSPLSHTWVTPPREMFLICPSMFLFPSLCSDLTSVLTWACLLPFSTGTRAERAWRMRRSLWIYWGRGGAAAISASPSGPSALTPTEEPCPAPQLTSTTPCWSPSICATWPRRWDWVGLEKDVLKKFHTVVTWGVFLFFSSLAFLDRSPWRRGHRWRRWERTPEGFWRKCLRTCSWASSGWWPTCSARCWRDSSAASLSTWRDSTRSAPLSVHCPLHSTASSSCQSFQTHIQQMLKDSDVVCDARCNWILQSWDANYEAIVTTKFNLMLHLCFFIDKCLKNYRILTAYAT